MAKVSVDKASLERVLAKLTNAVQESVEQGIKNGLFHLPNSDRNALWVATDLLQKSGKFPAYKFTFYHQGMGAETNTCAVTFIENNNLINHDSRTETAGSDCSEEISS